MLEWNTYILYSLLTEEREEHDAYDNGDDGHEIFRAKQPQHYHNWIIQGKKGEKYDDDDYENSLLLVSKTSSVDLLWLSITGYIYFQGWWRISKHWEEVKFF